jgi:hypothetical protein
MESKPWYQSKTIVGIVVLVLSSLLQKYAPNLPGCDADLTAIVEQILQAAGGILAVYGRIKAVRPIATPSITGASSLFLVFSFLFVTAGFMGGCAKDGSVAPRAQIVAAISSAGSQLLSDAWTMANELQKQNNGNLIPPSVVTTLLDVTHNKGDAATAAVANQLVGQMIGAITAAKGLRGTPLETQLVVNQVLDPAAVQDTVSSIAPATVPAAANP